MKIMFNSKTEQARVASQLARWSAAPATISFLALVWDGTWESPFNFLSSYRWMLACVNACGCVCVPACVRVCVLAHACVCVQMRAHVWVGVLRMEEAEEMCVCACVRVCIRFQLLQTLTGWLQSNESAVKTTLDSNIFVVSETIQLFSSKTETEQKWKAKRFLSWDSNRSSVLRFVQK